MTDARVESPRTPGDSPVAQAVLDATGTSAHAGCLFCGKQNPIGFRLEFHAREDGSVHARFPCGRLLQSYHETLHGGVVAALLDSAMTNCLFARGIAAVTAELTVRYLSPVRLEHPAELTAMVTKAHGQLYHLRAELAQDGAIAARASARFMAKDRRSPPGTVAAPPDPSEGGASGPPPSPHPEPRPIGRPR